MSWICCARRKLRLVVLVLEMTSMILCCKILKIGIGRVVGLAIAELMPCRESSCEAKRRCCARTYIGRCLSLGVSRYVRFSARQRA
jgi:hypothetical protein